MCEQHREITLAVVFRRRILVFGLVSLGLLPGCNTADRVKIEEFGVDPGFIPAPGEQVSPAKPAGAGAVERAEFIVKAADEAFRVTEVSANADSGLKVRWIGTCLKEPCLGGLGYWNDASTLFLERYLSPAPMTVAPGSRFHLAFRIEA